MNSAGHDGLWPSWALTARFGSIGLPCESLGNAWAAVEVGVEDGRLDASDLRTCRRLQIHRPDKTRSAAEEL